MNPQTFTFRILIQLAGNGWQELSDRQNGPARSIRVTSQRSLWRVWKVTSDGVVFLEWLPRFASDEMRASRELEF